jgi:hypothetical protein
MFWVIGEFEWFRSEFLVKILNILLWLKNIIMKFNSYNEIGDDGASKLGEGLSKLLNLKSLNLNF